MDLKKKIEQNLHKALKDKAALKISTFRLVLAAIKHEEIAKKRELEEDEILSLIQKEIKKRQEAKEAYQKGAREELAQKEEDEISILREYLPEPLSDSELKNIIQKEIKKTGAQSAKDMGKVIGQVVAQTKGRADGKQISEMVREFLN